MNHLTTQRPLFFSIGLVLACLLVVTAFEWKVYQTEKINLSGWERTDGPGFVPLPLLGEVIEKQESVQSTYIKGQTFEQKQTVIPTQAPLPTSLPPPTIPALDEANYGGNIKKEEKKEDKFICLLPVEEYAHPKEGYKTFYKFLMDHIQYPTLAKTISVAGKIFIRFVVDEVIRVLKTAPKWIPAKRNGIPKASYCSIPMYIHPN